MKAWYNAKTGEMKILVEAPEDLIHLERFVEKGCIVTGTTLRSKEIIRGGERVKVGKERIMVSIEVEKIELKENSLKLLGRIVEASKEASGYHSLEVKCGDTVRIKKEWKPWEIERIKALAKPREKILACVLDERECCIYAIGERVEELGRVERSGAGKESGESEALKLKYFAEIYERIKDWRGKIIIAGPGFAKEEFAKYLEERGFERGSLFLDSVSHVGRPGVSELLRRKTMERVLKASRITEESETVEKFFEALAREEPVVYGEEEVRKALESFALEKLLVSDKLLKKYRELIDLAEESGAEVMLVSSSHPAGERFYHFCGIAGFLRFRVNS